MLKKLSQDSPPFHDKNTQQIEENYLNIIKAICQKSTANIIFNGKRLKVFLLKSGTRQRYTLLLLLFNIVMQFQARAIRQEKRKRIHIGNVY
jgi:hypothetical protein